MCDEWLKDPASFIYWCVFNGWQEGLQLDRIDNNKGYSPDNCRFVTPKENLRNTRVNIVVNYRGEDYVLKNLCEMKGMPYHLVWDRINRQGYSVERAIEQPKKKWERQKAA
jgi:hypothetical protein